jgi:prepilin-type processing-associated H-X9-DG protein
MDYNLQLCNGLCNVLFLDSAVGASVRSSQSEF